MSEDRFLNPTTVIRRLTSSRLTAFRTHVVFPQTQYKKRNAQILYYEADDVLELLNSNVRPHCWNPEAKRLWRSWETSDWGEDLDSWLVALRYLRTVIRGSREQQQLDMESKGCLLAIKKFWMRRHSCPARHIWFLQVIFRDSRIATSTAGQCRCHPHGPPTMFISFGDLS